MFYKESSKKEREAISARVDAWLKGRQGLCALSNHKATNELLCEDCEQGRLESASATRILHGTGLTIENAEMFAQKRYITDFFVLAAQDSMDDWLELVEGVTESINEE